MAKNQLITAENFNLITLEENMSEAIREELDGLGTIPFDKVKIPSGGGLAFEIPGEDEETPEMTTEIIGVILYHYPMNAFWKEKYNGDSNQPDCASLDGKIGIDSETGKKIDCTTCPRNQYGSDGKGKACKNMHRCFILRENSYLPVLLTLPPTSLNSLKNYLGKKILLNNLRSYMAITKITLKKEKSADGIIYSKAVFSFGDRLSPEQIAKAETMMKQLKLMTQPDITNDDYNSKAEKKTDDSVFTEQDEVLDANELPPEFTEAENA